MITKERRRPLWNDDERSDIINSILVGVTQKEISKHIKRDKEVVNKASLWLQDTLQSSIKAIESVLGVSKDVRIEIMDHLINTSLGDNETDRLLKMLLDRQRKQKRRKIFEVGNYKTTDNS